MSLQPRAVLDHHRYFHSDLCQQPSQLLQYKSTYHRSFIPSMCMLKSMTASYNHRTWWVLPLLHVPKYPEEIFHGWLGLNYVHNYNNSQIEIFSHKSVWDKYYYHALCFLHPYAKACTSYNYSITAYLAYLHYACETQHSRYLQIFYKLNVLIAW